MIFLNKTKLNFGIIYKIIFLTIYIFYFEKILIIIDFEKKFK